ncbi:MAG: SDR family oxidoreductase [Phycisphaerales bacterium]|nr:SDR family oxidoreductase [Phycisphaerales bacterium]
MGRIDLRDRPICITGGNAGIGRATALACAAAGMPVVIGARREDRLAEVVGLIRERGGRATSVVMDVSIAADGARMLETCVSTYGSVYGVFANAGYGFEQPLASTSDEDLRRIFEVNFWGSLNVIRPALPLLRKAGAGHVLLCSSALAILPVPRYGPYCATKAAQHHVGRALNVELRGSGVHVSTVHPVWTRTEFGEVVRTESGGQTSSDRKPGFLVQPPERVARAVVRCLGRPRAEVWTSLPTRLGMAAAVAFPGLADRLIGRVMG